MPGRPRRSAGFVLIYGLILLTALSALGSLAVDYGRVQLVRLQVQRTADFAARAAAYELSGYTGNATQATSVATIAAAALATANPSDGVPLALAPGDVVVGNWDGAQSPVFSTARLPYNAVRVTVRRDGTANPQVPLTLGAFFGKASVVVSATGVAHVVPPPSPHGLVGIDSATFGSVGVLASVTGDLVSNGPVSVGMPLGLGVSVTGNAQSFNSSVAKASAAVVSGTTALLPAALNYPSVVLPATNDNAAIAACLNGHNDCTILLGRTLPAGTYVVHDLNILSGVDVNVAGPVIFYVTGSLNLAAGVNLLGSANTDPSNFVVNVARGGSVRFLANLVAPIAMVVYAPDSDITIAVGVNRFTGTLVGKTLNIALPAVGRFVEVKPTAILPVVRTLA